MAYVVKKYAPLINSVDSERGDEDEEKQEKPKKTGKFAFWFIFGIFCAFFFFGLGIFVIWKAMSDFFGI